MFAKRKCINLKKINYNYIKDKNHFHQFGTLILNQIISKCIFVNHGVIERKISNNSEFNLDISKI